MSVRSFAATMLFFIAGPALAQSYGDGVAAYSLGRYDKAVEIWRSLADSHPDAQFRLGDLYERGIGVARSFDLAAEWYRKAAANGHADAQFSYARLYDMGHGVDKSPEAAWQWYLKAAESGSAPAQYHVANAYMSGKGVERDLVQAYVWFTRAAESFGPGPEGNFSLTAIETIGAALRPDDRQLAAQLLSAKPIKSNKNQ